MVAKRRKFFEKLALEAKPQAPARLDRSEIPKRLGAGMDSYAVVWMPMAHDNIPAVDDKPPRDPVIDRPQERETSKPGKRPGVMVPRLGNIVQNRKALLQRCRSSLVPDNEDTTIPVKFSMLRSVLSQAPLASNGGDSRPASPIDESPLTLRLPPAAAPATGATKQGELEHYFLNLVMPASSSEDVCLDDEPSLEEAFSDYESDSSQSSSDFSEWSSPSLSPGSPDTDEPKRSWSQAYAKALGQPPFPPPGEDVTWAEVKDAIGQLNAAIADEKEYVVSDDAIELLQLAGSHVANRDIQAAHDALMHALGGVTKIQTVQIETPMLSPSPTLSEPALDPGDEAPTDEECTSDLDHWLRMLKQLATDYPKSARGSAAKALRQDVLEMFKVNSERTVHTFLMSAIRDLRQLPLSTRLEPAEGFWT
jgi:hypothetical protein